MDPVVYGRALIGMSLAIHISIAVMGVGLPLLIAVVHYLGLRRNHVEWLALARHWTRIFTLLFAVGAATGIAVPVQLAILWPDFMATAGKIISIPFTLELYAFLLEGVALGVYVFGRDRFRSPWAHWAWVVPMGLGSALSATLITTVNSFMNTPAGFDIINGAIANPDPWQAMFNPSAGVRVAHVLVTAYFTAAFALTGWAAYGWLKGDRRSYYKKALSVTMTVALIFGIGAGVTGDLSAQAVAVQQPAKLAAYEGLFETQSGAAMQIGGWASRTEERVIGGIEIPKLLSWLAFRDTGAVVQGLDATPKSQWPPLLVHLLFDVMVGLAVSLTLLAAVYIFVPKAREEWLRSRWWPTLLVLSAPLAWLNLESGWLTDELGRQPWILYGLVRVDETFTQSANVPAVFWSSLVIYAGVVVVTALGIFRNEQLHPMSQELAEVQPWLDSPRRGKLGVHA